MFKKAEAKTHVTVDSHKVVKHEKPEKPKPEPTPVVDPKDQRIAELERTLTWLRDNAVQGNPNHVRAIDGVLDTGMGK